MTKTTKILLHRKARKKRHLIFNKQKLFENIFHNLSRRSISNAVIETGMFK